MLQYYAYLWGDLLLGVIWLIFFLDRKDLRKEIFTTSFLFSVLGFTEIAFSEYWSPPTLFNLINRIGFSIEDILFMFFIGGICSCIFEVLFSKKDVVMRHKIHRHRGLIAALLALIISVIIEHIYPLQTIYTLSFLGIIFSLYFVMRRKDLFFEALISGVIFTILYTLTFLFLFQYIGFYNLYYHIENLSGIFLFGNPIEEYLFAFVSGFSGAIIYKYIFDEEITKLKSSN